MPRSIVVTIPYAGSPGHSGVASSPGQAGWLVTGLLGSVLLLAACAVPLVRADTPMQEVPVTDPAATDQPADPATITLTGTRLTQGNAVDCPTLRDDAGVVHTVSYLSPAVAIGARVTVTGFYGVTTSCLGTVLVVQSEDQVVP